MLQATLTAEYLLEPLKEDMTVSVLADVSRCVQTVLPPMTGRFEC